MSDQKTLLGVVLCILFYLGYTQYLQQKYPEYGKAQQPKKEIVEPSPELNSELGKTDSSLPVPSNTSQKKEEAVLEAADSQQRPNLPLDQAVLENEVLRLVWDSGRPALTRIELKKFNENLKSKQKADFKPVDLAGNPVLVQTYTDKSYALPITVKKISRSGAQIIFEGEGEGLTTRQEFSLLEGQNYGAKLLTTVYNSTSQARNLKLAVSISQNLREGTPSTSSILSFLPGMPTQLNHLTLGIDAGHKQQLLSEACGEDQRAAQTFFEGANTQVDFLGIDRHYFLSLLSPVGKGYDYLIRRIDSQNNQCVIEFLSSQDQGLLQANSQITVESLLYFGPKESGQLTAASQNLKKALDLGFFDKIGQPLLSILRWFQSFVKNYGLAIILLTILLKLAFYPLTKAAAVSMKNMQKLQPEMNRIKEKFKNDKAQQQQEIMKFMSAHKINPAKGCLPILPQIPVFIAFYSVLSQSIELRHAPFFGWIQDLSAADHFT